MNKKQEENIKDLTNIISQIFCLDREKPDREYTFFSRNLKNQGMFSKIDHISGYEDKISKFCEVELLQTLITMQ